MIDFKKHPCLHCHEREVLKGIIDAVIDLFPWIGKIILYGYSLDHSFIPSFQGECGEPGFPVCSKQVLLDGVNTISKLLGHRDLRMTKRYAHLNVDSLRSAVSRLDITFLSRSDGATHAEII